MSETKGEARNLLKWEKVVVTPVVVIVLFVVSLYENRESEWGV